MIKPQDWDFHFDADSHWQWVETIYLPFSVPEASLNGNIYVLTRPKMGVTMCDVSLNDRISFLWEDQLYIDNQQHLPCPKSLMEFSLPNGLSLKAIEPLKRYQVKYEGIDDTRFDLEYVALHEPFDLNDPKMDPAAAKRSGPAWNTSWNGHYDQTYRIRGKLVARGKKYDVDCVDTGDRSWGPRPERDNASAIWIHFSFGERLTVQLFIGHDIANTKEMGPHISGYILEDGKVYGITDSRGSQEYFKAIPAGGELEVTDVRGKKFNVTFSTMNASYWAAYPACTYPHIFMRANCEGEIGYGVQQIVISRAYFGRHRDALMVRTGA